MKYSGINGRTLKMLVGGVISSLAMVLVMALSSCNKNPMEVITIQERESNTANNHYILSDAITIHWARMYNFHDVGICWPIIWRRKYRINVDFIYSYHIDARLPLPGLYIWNKAVVVNGNQTTYEAPKIYTRDGYVHYSCSHCQRKKVIAYTCKIDNPMRFQVRFQFITQAGRQVYDLWSNVYYVPIINQKAKSTIK